MSATPEQIAERLEKPANWLRQDRGEHWKSATNIYDRAPFEAAALIRAQGERVKVLEALLQRLEPSIGWRSATGTSRDFACEFCHQTHAHFAHIEHTDACPVTQVRAALKAAP